MFSSQLTVGSFLTHLTLLIKWLTGGFYFSICTNFVRHFLRSKMYIYLLKKARCIYILLKLKTTIHLAVSRYGQPL